MIESKDLLTELTRSILDLKADHTKYSKYSLPNIVDEVPFEIEMDGGKKI